MPMVLLVNTRPNLGALLEKRFSQEGFAVALEQWSHGEDLELGRASPDLVVVGQVVGQDPAHGLLRHLEERGLHGVPVIFLTPGEATADQEHQDMPPEAQQLRMPFRPSQLVALARKAMTHP